MVGDEIKVGDLFLVPHADLSDDTKTVLVLVRVYRQESPTYLWYESVNDHPFNKDFNASFTAGSPTERFREEATRYYPIMHDGMKNDPQPADGTRPDSVQPSPGEVDPKAGEDVRGTSGPDVLENPSQPS